MDDLDSDQSSDEDSLSDLDQLGDGPTLLDLKRGKKPKVAKDKERKQRLRDDDVMSERDWKAKREGKTVSRKRQFPSSDIRSTAEDGHFLPVSDLFAWL